MAAPCTNFLSDGLLAAYDAGQAVRKSLAHPYPDHQPRLIISGLSYNGRLYSRMLIQSQAAYTGGCGG
jgi:hypothetical protein